MLAQRWVRTSLVLLAGLAVGCGNVKQAANNAKARNDLKEIGLVYIDFQQSKGKPPTGPEDLLPLASPELKKALESGSYTILWKTKADIGSVTGQPKPETVLAYHNEVPTSGGLVAMTDGTVREMTAQEFQAANKGSGK